MQISLADDNPARSAVVPVDELNGLSFFVVMPIRLLEILDREGDVLDARPLE